MATTNKVTTNKQITKTTGNYYHANLDAISMQSLEESRQIHRHSHGDNFSNSIIIRRSLRFYLSYMKTLSDTSQELIETKRAAKGVI